MPEDLSPKWDGLAPAPPFEEYSARYAEFLALTRRDGIVEARLHTDGGPFRYSLAGHNSWGRAWRDIGADPDNEVLIITGTGDSWYESGGPETFDRPFHEWSADEAHRLYADSAGVLEGLVFGVDMPTIAAINGPARAHSEFALACDITLCTPDTTLRVSSFSTGVTPGDGQALTFQELGGTKWAAHHMYTSDRVDAETALRVGLVNEVVPRDQLSARAWALAEMIMRRPRNARRMTHALAVRPWKRRLVQDFGFHLSHELFAISADKPVGEHGGHNVEPLD